jgi:hypothetical protein
MACYEVGTRVGLTDREAVSLTDVRGATLRVTRGIVWLTQEHDPRDVVLRAGDNWVVERKGRTVIEAQGAATLYVVGRAVAPARPRRAPAFTWRNLLRGWSLAPRQPLPYV